MSEAQIFAKTWLATKGRIENAFRFRMSDDTGTLELHDGTAQFRGRKQTLVIHDIINARMVSQRPNWIAIVLMFAVAAPFALVASYLEPSRSLKLDLAVLVVAALYGVYMNSRVKWVCVSYRDKDGILREAFFADGSNFGWGGIRGKTQKICDAINAAKNTKSNGNEATN
jgi:hypothetical protein